MNYVALFFAGALLCNCIPHLCAGLQGMPFPSPFAKPSGIGNSSPLINVLWGGFNICVGLYLLSNHPVAIGANPECAVLAVGAAASGIFLAVHFGKVRQGKAGNA